LWEIEDTNVLNQIFLKEALRGRRKTVREQWGVVRRKKGKEKQEDRSKMKKVRNFMARASA